MKVLRDEAVITRLGQGLSENHFFDSVPMKRTIEALKKFKKTCDKLKVKKIVAVGTHACRTAANAKVFTGNVKKECGIKVDIITGNQEADLAFLSAWKDFGSKKKKLIVVDIGGGSTEIITGPISSKKQQPANVISLPLGSVRLTEQCIRSDPISEEDFYKLHLATRNGLVDELDDFYPASFAPEKYAMVATAGTATTLAALDKKIKKYLPNKIQGSILKKEKLEGLINELVQKNVKERQKMPGMEPLRADVILAGALLLNEILKYYKQEEVKVSDRGLRYGVFYKKFMKK